MVSMTHRIPPQPPEDKVAVAERGQPDAIVGALTPEVFDWFVEIRTARRRLPVVCIIEILIPANKESGSESYREYRSRQQEILRSDTRLMEIDLLRGGMHTAGVSVGSIPKRGDRWDYLICLSRSTDRSKFECWYNNVVNPLPEVRVPLLGDTPDVILDLQAAFHKAYASGPYVHDIDYDEPLTPTLPDEKALWAREIVQRWKRT